jgi:hypothetical protein
MRKLTLFAALLSVVAIANTTANFDNDNDSSYLLQALGQNQTYPEIQKEDGSDNSFLQLNAAHGSQDNWIVFDRSDEGKFANSSFSFSFRLDQLTSLGWGGADGFSICFLSTDIFGASSGFSESTFHAEDPAALGILGIGFDTFNNGDVFEAPGPFGSNYSEISLFFNGNLITRVNDTRLLPLPFNLKDDKWHEVRGTIDYANHRVSMKVDDSEVFSSVSVTGLAPVESRVAFGGRTGAGYERTSIDNVSVEYSNEAK